MRRQAPAFPSPPVVRPNDQPFPFEANMRQHSQHQSAPIPGPGPSNRPSQLHIPRENNHDFLPPRPLQAAPPSHHVPALGLGGALIAQNRNRHHHQHRPYPHPPYEAGNSFLSRVGSGVRRILGGPALAPEDGPQNTINFLAIRNNFGFFDGPLADDDEFLAMQALAEDEGEGLRDLDPAFNPARAYYRSEGFRRRNVAREESPYRKEYTHPLPPEPGFTFDFAPKSPVEVIDVTSPVVPKKERISSPEPIVIDDEEESMTSDVGPSTNADKTPIPSSASTSVSKPRPHTPQKSTGTTVLACARCLDPLVLSNNLTSEDQKNRRIWGLRCGHLIDGKCLKEIGQPHYTEQPTDLGAENSSAIDRKGKGKAKVVDDEVDHDEHIHNPGSYDPEAIGSNTTTSIRSRLRPRNIPTSTSTGTSPFSSSHSAVKRNARAKQMPPPEYIWHCPVTGCGRIHVSVKVNGEWVPEREDVTSSSGGGGPVGGRGRGRGAGRGRGRTSLFGILNNDGDRTSGTEGARGAIPLFL